MIDYRNEIMALIEKCLHVFAEQRIVEMGIEQSWQSRLANEVKNRYPLHPTDYMLLHRFLQNHAPNEIDLKNLDTTAMCALFNYIPDFMQMCEIPTAQKGTFYYHINSLKNSRNTIEHYVRGILPEQHREFHFDQLNALYNIAAFASLAERHCQTNDTWRSIILESTQLEKRFHWEKWMLQNETTGQILYSDENLSDIITKAESGDTESQIKAGKIYFYGRQSGTKPDYEHALLWFSKAAIKDNPEVKYYLALCLEHSLALFKYKGNTFIKEELIEESANQGYAPAQLRLGHRYFAKLNSTEEEKAWVYKWTKRAADQDYAPAIWTLSLLYYAGTGVEKDEKEYYRLSHRASELGYSHATLTLGEEAEKKGEYEEALDLYRLAETQGHPDAQSKIHRLERRIKRNQNENTIQ